MGRANTSNLKSGKRDRADLVIYFPTNGSSDPASCTSDCGATVAHTTTGVLTITLADTYLACEGSEAHLSMNAPNGSIATVQAIDLSAKTVVVYTLDASGSAADIAAHANNHVTVRLRMKLVA